MAKDPLITLLDIGRKYVIGAETIHALKSVSLTIEKGEFVALMGPSGSGKSTLMNIMGCLDRPTSGAYTIEGQSLAHLDEDKLAALRRENFGFVFQNYNLE